MPSVVKATVNTVGEGRIEHPRQLSTAFTERPASTYGLLSELSRGGWVRTSMQPVILSTLYKSEGIHLVFVLGAGLEPRI